jgi:hypothetical protein
MSLKTKITSGYDNIVLCSGHELNGFDKNIFQNIKNPVVAYIKQDPTCRNERNGDHNPSLNGTTATAMAIATITRFLSVNKYQKNLDYLKPKRF